MWKIAISYISILIALFYCSAKADETSLSSEFEFIGYLENNLETVTNETIQLHISKINNLENKTDLNDWDRGKVELAYSGLTGLYAKKNNSAHYGKISVEKLTSALRISPNDPVIVEAYSKMIAIFMHKNPIVRRFIEARLDINLKKCKAAAIERLLALPPETKDIQEILRSLNGE